MIPDNMLPPSESDSDDDENNALLTANPNRPLMNTCNDSESDSGDDTDLSLECDNCDDIPNESGASREKHVTRDATHFN